MRALLIALIVIGAAPAVARAAQVDRPGLYRGGQPLPLVASDAEVDVVGPFADVVVRQTFRNPEASPIEAVYVFPLPADAAVSAMTIRTGERTITAHIARRDQARAAHEEAVAAGVAAALTEAERADVFTQAVAGIAAGATVTVELRWETRAVRRAGAWELVYPLVLAPRYVPGRPTGAPSVGVGRAVDTDRARDASVLTPPVRDDGGGAPIRLRIHLRGPVTGVDCPSHEVAIRPRGRGADLEIVDARGDHDAVVRWRGPATAAVLDPAGWIAVVVDAPAAPGPRRARDWFLVVDRSRSTEGDTDVLTRQAVAALLDRLSAGDRLAAVDAAGRVIAPLGPARAAALRLRAWLEAAPPSGAADLASGLTAARRLLDGAAGAPDAIVVVSDGLVANDAEVLAALAGAPARVFALGLGAAPNRWLLGALAARGGGGARFAGAGDDIAAIASAVVGHAAAPALAGIAIDWGALDAAEPAPARIGDLGAGDAAIVLARVATPRAARLHIRAAGVDRTVDVAATWDGVPLARQWASARIADLLAAGDAAAVQRLGLAHGVVTPYTALIAVGEDVIDRGGVRTSITVPVALPAGMRWQAVFGPGGEDVEAGDVLDGESIEIEGRAPVIDRAPTASVDTSEVVQGESIASAAGRRFAIGVALGGSADGELVGALTARLVIPVGDRLATGGEIAVLASPGRSAEDRLAVALLAALGRTGLLDGWLTLDVGLGVRAAADPGLGYAGAIRVGPGRAGGLLRWDGGLVLDGGGLAHRGALTLGLELRF